MTVGGGRRDSSHRESALAGTAAGFHRLPKLHQLESGKGAVSAFAGDLSFHSGSILLLPGQSVSIAIPDDASDVGGFNGPAYFFRPAVEITLNGTMSDGALSQAIALFVADADIHSGVSRTDSFGLTSDSFVLQGGDPWGFDPGDDFELSQAIGVYVFARAVPEPGSAALLAAALSIAATHRYLLGATRPKRNAAPRPSNSLTFPPSDAIRVTEQ